MKPKVKCLDIGLRSYQEVWIYQTELHDELKAIKKHNKEIPENTPLKKQKNYFIFCEHPHVYTLGKSGAKENLLLNERELSENEIDFFPINRGGDITYHGPGQIVGYPILDLDLFYNDIHRYVRTIEETIIRVLKEYGIEGGRIEGMSGVWLDGHPKRKICAVGIHLSRWVTMHGFAFNVNTDLDMFGHIIPCGITDKDKSVTSLSKELGVDKTDLNEVKEKIKKHFSLLMNFDWVF